MKKALATMLLMSSMVLAVGCMSTPQSGEISVVRNGKAWYWPLDWFDNHKIRGIIQNGASNTWTGLGSDVHPYPVSTQQRYYRMETCVDDHGAVPCENADTVAVTVPTSDGVEATISGTFYFYTAFDGTKKGDDLLKSFDTQFATRTFGGKHVYDGQSGFSSWLGVIVEPVSANNLRSSISGVTCAELVSSCALVQNQGQQASKKAEDLANGKVNQSNINRIQDEVSANLKRDLESTLGQDYFRDIKFQISGVTLPVKIQDAINDAQSAFAAVSQAQAKIQSARAEALANEAKQRSYETCPACATIDSLKAIPPSVTTFAPGAGFAITQGGKR